MRLPLNSSGIIFSLEQSYITVTVVLVNTNLTYRLHSRYQSTVEFQLSAKGAGDMNLKLMILKSVNCCLPHV